MLDLDRPLDHREPKPDTGARLEGITISNNSFTNVGIRDITMQSSLSDSSISDICISGNSFDAPVRLSDVDSFVSIRGGSTFEGDQNSRARLDGLSITNNSFTAANDSALTCVSIAADHVPFGVRGSGVNASAVDITIDSNTFVGCGTAVELIGGLADQTSGSVSDSTLSGALLSNDTVSRANTAVDIVGTWVAPAPTSIQFNEDVDVDMAGNSFNDVAINAITVSAVSTGIAITGREFVVAGTGAVHQNTVGSVSVTQLSADGVGLLCTDSVDTGDLATNNALQTTCAEIVAS